MKQYSNPTFELILCTNEDIITSSLVTLNGTYNNDEGYGLDFNDLIMR